MIHVNIVYDPAREEVGTVQYLIVTLYDLSDVDGIHLLGIQQPYSILRRDSLHSHKFRYVGP